MRNADPLMQEIPRSQVERVARVMGDASAAAHALAKADSHDGRVRFWWTRGLYVVEAYAPPDTEQRGE